MVYVPPPPLLVVRSHDPQGRWRRLLLTALAWLAIANAWTFPHYLSYFNEAIGGPSQGWHYFADSNIDWWCGGGGSKRRSEREREGEKQHH